ncbi:MAG: LacI family DNA-binding transcriptional regulator, partial [Planctomycetes bacterium]|nr:LacI family DNA-binding transcriptional regulator [Planctomycetota bacterium]MBM4058654.1 LacI family DNA-binding transcriptional regulator [Planctomycetota bacterium]
MDHGPDSDRTLLRPRFEAEEVRFPEGCSRLSCADRRIPRLSITVRDVAAAAGVSPGTASRALRGHPQISEECISRV